MDQNDLFQAFDDVDDDILERSETIVGHRKKKIGWLKWGPWRHVLA